MKKAVFLIILISTISLSQVGIGTTSPNASSALDITSSNSGILIPRMTEAQRDANSSPGCCATALGSGQRNWQPWKAWRCRNKTGLPDRTGSSGNMGYSRYRVNPALDLMVLGAGV